MGESEPETPGTCEVNVSRQPTSRPLEVSRHSCINDREAGSLENKKNGVTLYCISVNIGHSYSRLVLSDAC